MHHLSSGMHPELAILDAGHSCLPLFPQSWNVHRVVTLRAPRGWNLCGSVGKTSSICQVSCHSDRFRQLDQLSYNRDLLRHFLETLGDGFGNQHHRLLLVGLRCIHVARRSKLQPACLHAHFHRGNDDTIGSHTYSRPSNDEPLSSSTCLSRAWQRLKDIRQAIDHPITKAQLLQDIVRLEENFAKNGPSKRRRPEFLHLELASNIRWILRVE
mmetsp:Transcript_52955/g.141522  ORF Transcript_52955/g.141522 Transcript_52955/m.141522 type:complete len:213 (+) Transcript_52955:235-873(+)